MGGGRSYGGARLGRERSYRLVKSRKSVRMPGVDEEFKELKGKGDGEV